MDYPIKSLKVENFRCHSTADFDFGDKKTILITGNNGSGKTSLLEAIHLCLRGKSFKTTKPDVFLKSASPFCRAEVLYGDIPRIFYYNIAAKQKTFLVNGEKHKILPRRQSIPTIVFEGDDLVLFQTLPANRRKYLDELLSQIYPKYVYAVSRYRRALTQRNFLLKSEQEPRRDDLFTWDKLLIQYGLEIVNYREKIIDELCKHITNVYQKIAGNYDKIEIHFSTEILEKNEAWWQNELIKNYPLDRKVGHTLLGCQHDDMIFYFNGERAIDVASRGEVRTLILALKFIEANIVTKTFGTPPVILLDDIFSELDESRQKTLLGNFKSNQIFITATHPPHGLKSDFILG